MTITLHQPHTSRHSHTTRNLVAGLLAVAAVVFAAQALGNTQNPSITYDTDRTRPAVVDPTGLGTALSITYDTDRQSR